MHASDYANILLSSSREGNYFPPETVSLTDKEIREHDTKENRSMREFGVRGIRNVNLKGGE
jgi:hypothetical protein